MAAVTISGFDGSHEVEDVASVLDALSAAGISPEVTVRLSGRTVTNEYELEGGERLIVTPPEVKQGR